VSGLIGTSVPRRDAPALVPGAGQREAIVTDPESPLNAVRGRAEAHIVKDE